MKVKKILMSTMVISSILCSMGSTNVFADGFVCFEDGSQPVTFEQKIEEPSDPRARVAISDGSLKGDWIVCNSTTLSATVTGTNCQGRAAVSNSGGSDIGKWAPQGSSSYASLPGALSNKANWALKY